VPQLHYSIESIALEDVPKPRSFDGPYSLTHSISPNNTQRLLVGVVEGPEHIEVTTDPLGSIRLWTAAENGSVYSMEVSGSSIKADTVREEVYVGPGRPLGFAWDHAHGMYICDSLQVRNPEASFFFHRSGIAQGSLGGVNIWKPLQTHPSRPLHQPST
jgi:hypothetical protein